MTLRSIPSLCLAGLLGCSCPKGMRAVAVISAAEDDRLELCAEVARTEEERQRGLMGHAPLESGQGMLFEFPVEGEVCFWNSGVSFAIDIMYARADGTVMALDRAVAAEDRTLRCHWPVAWVLETAAHELSAFRAGDTLTP